MLEFTGRPHRVAAEDPLFATLSAREREILAAVVAGQNNPKSVPPYSSARRRFAPLTRVWKLGVRTRTQAAVLARSGFATRAVQRRRIRLITLSLWRRSRPAWPHDGLDRRSTNTLADQALKQPWEWLSPLRHPATPRVTCIPTFEWSSNPLLAHRHWAINIARSRHMRRLRLRPRRSSGAALAILPK